MPICEHGPIGAPALTCRDDHHSGILQAPAAARPVFLAVLSCLCLAGCGASLTLPPVTTATTSPIASPVAASDSAPTSAPQTPAPSGVLTPSGSTPTVDGTTISIYNLIAKGALTCWFGPGAPLKGTHIFHADVPSPTEKRDVDVTLHERDTTGQPNPRGTRAFRITLSAEADTRTRVVMQIGKLPADLATAMEKDVVAWAHGRESCEAQVVRPPPPPAPPEPPAKKQKRSKKA